MFSRKGVLKICSKFIGEHPWWSVISIKFLFNFIEIALRHGCSPVNLLHIFRAPFCKNTSGWLLVVYIIYIFTCSLLNPYGCLRLPNGDKKPIEPTGSHFFSIDIRKIAVTKFQKWFSFIIYKKLENIITLIAESETQQISLLFIRSFFICFLAPPTNIKG